jgi:hypothetical protein
MDNQPRIPLHVNPRWKHLVESAWQQPEEFLLVFALWIPSADEAEVEEDVVRFDKPLPPLPVEDGNDEKEDTNAMEANEAKEGINEAMETPNAAIEEPKKTRRWRRIARIAFRKLRKPNSGKKENGSDDTLLDEDVPEGKHETEKNEEENPKRHRQLISKLRALFM